MLTLQSNSINITLHFQVSLSASPVALKAAARASIGLLTWQADNTVKLIILDRLKEISERHRPALEEFVIDILRSLSCPSNAVRKKALNIALNLVTPATVNVRSALCMQRVSVTVTLAFV